MSSPRSSPQFDAVPPLAIIGWREWLALPQIQVPRVKAKIDTGARSSSLHAFDLEFFRRQGKDMIRFTVHPHQRNHRDMVQAEAELLDERQVRNSGGGTECRPVIQTLAQLGDHEWLIELTLTRRDAMGFRMLLGRQAVRQRFLVDASRSFLFSVNPHRLKQFGTKNDETGGK
ncbi:ATP-dependent zinc protease [Synechococcales cyanobacterium C]|uniref:ATP-dependent zinc protease n=1 Tax=Petrachloros mirabilis ULC683 TaxID=2781853 RepID=A0A8K2AGS1_9CYAN|nr:RimK/LysX family protein [Petrachloros mirabilis]NCJ05054.1 ATP-dependent zinc protease [Petrachloros mirabilis ULC683]